MPSTEVTAHETLEQRAARLREVLATPSERDLAARELVDVETQIAAEQQAGLMGEAEKRLLGIVRAVGSLADQSTLDNNRLLDAAQVFLDKAQVLSERFDRITLLKHEARTLCEVFGLPVPDLAVVAVPANRRELLQAFETVQRAPARDTGRVDVAYEWVKAADGRLMQGPRTYAELAETPGGELIRRKVGK